jgi:hypothetical protein
MTNRNTLLANHKASVAELKSLGFEKVCGVLAGIDSGSVWMHDDGRTADVTVRNENRISYRARGEMTAVSSASARGEG